MNAADDLGKELADVESYLEHLKTVVLSHTQPGSGDIVGVQDEIRWIEVERDVLRERLSL